MVKGEFIEDDNSINSNSSLKEEKLKEQLLDEAFKKAEGKRSVKKTDNKKIKKTSYEKKFPKLWILLIIIAIIGLIAIDYVSWGYIKYDTGNSKIEVSISRDFILNNGSKKVDDINVSKNITNLFSQPYHLGLSTNDFTSAPDEAYNGFICLIILGVLIMVFGVIDKLINFSSEIFICIHFVIVTSAIFPCMFIVLSAIKFIGAQILLYYNIHFINAKILTVAFPAAFVLVILGFVTIRMIFTVIRMDFKEMQKLSKTDVTGVTTSAYGE